MQCRFCSYNNPGDVERCARCHKRLSGDITLDGAILSGANALAPRRQRVVLDDSREGTAESSTFSGSALPESRGGRRTPAAAAVGQTSLSFNTEGSSNVIPFEAIQRPVALKAEVLRKASPSPSAVHLAVAKQAIRKAAESTSATSGVLKTTVVRSSMSESQGSLNLEFLPPAPQAPRTLKTTVEAQIYCDAPVATPMHRFVASILDGIMIAIGAGMFLGIFQCFGGGIAVNKFNVLMLAASLILITMFYGLLFAISGRETAGQAWTDLRLINFDGFPPDGVSRALRFMGCWLSFCSGGIGLVWALLDEENLTWHDHMSKTFVTLRELNTTFVRERLS